MRRLIFLLVAAAVCMGAGSYEQLSKRVSAYMTITSAADTVQEVTVVPSAGIDGFAYIDSFSYHADTTAHKTITWTSPVQSMALTPALDTTLTYACSVDVGTNVYGFEYVCPNGEDYDLDSLIDALVDSINNVAGMGDTLTAEDSSTYIKLVSQIAQANLEGDARWCLVLGDSLDTATIWNTSIAVVSDSMVANINASANLDSFLTASDDDTGYSVLGDYSSVPFFMAIKDSSQDTATAADTVTSVCTDEVTVGIGKVAGWKTLAGLIFVGPNLAGHAGAGVSCSSYVWLYSYGPGGRVLIDSAFEEADTVSLRVAITEAVGDTLLTERIGVVIRWQDTLSDTNYEAEHAVTWNLIAK